MHELFTRQQELNWTQPKPNQPAARSHKTTQNEGTQIIERN